MGVYIKGMEMPPSGTFNIVHIHSDGQVFMPSWGKGMAPVSGVEAVPVPPHGRLIDADEAIGHLFIGEQCLYSWDEIEESVDATPTIIPAEEGET